MNVSSLKWIAWLVAAGAGGGLAWYVTDFLMHRDQLDEDPRPKIQALLDNIPAPEIKTDHVIDYTRLKAGVSELDWTGRPPPPPPPPKVDGDEEIKKPPAQPVADLLRVLYIQVDAMSSARSLAHVIWKGDLASQAERGDLHVEDHLPDPHGDILVAEITPEGVWFGFADETRAKELVRPAELSTETSISEVAVGGASVPDPLQALFPRVPEYGPRYWPDETTLVRPGEYRVGTLDAERIGSSWSEVLANEVRHSRWRNPQTGRYEGIRINDIAHGSVAGKFGIQSGDIIKSINGHPVTSSNEAIAFVKKEVKEKVIDKWYVVVEHLGSDKTIVVHTPGQ